MLRPNYHQQATYWAPTGVDKFGALTFAAPVELLVRWEKANEEFIDISGKTVVSQSIVYLPEEVDIGGFLYEGLSVAADPRTVREAFKIKQYMETPNLRNLYTERKAML